MKKLEAKANMLETALQSDSAHVLNISEAMSEGCKLTRWTFVNVLELYGERMKRNAGALLDMEEESSSRLKALVICEAIHTLGKVVLPALTPQNGAPEETIEPITAACVATCLRCLVRSLDEALEEG